MNTSYDPASDATRAPAGWPAPTQDDRNWAAAAHLGSFLAAWVALGFLAPLLVLLLKGRDSAFVRHQAMESLNFQLTALLAIIVSSVLILVLIGIPMLITVGIAYLILVVIAGMRAAAGEWYRYPFTIRFFS